MPTQEEMAAAYDTVFGDDSMIHLPYYLLPTFSFTRGAIVKYPVPPSLALCSPPELRYDPSESSMEIDTSPLQEQASLGPAQVLAASEASKDVFNEQPVAAQAPRPQQKLPPAHSLKHKSPPPALSFSALKKSAVARNLFRFYHETEVVASSSFDQAAAHARADSPGPSLHPKDVEAKAFCARSRLGQPFRAR